MISAEQVIKKIKLFSETPIDNNLLYKDDEDFLEVVNSTFIGEVFPVYKELDKSFFLSYVDFPLKEKDYLIPLDAYNRSLYEIQIISKSNTVVKNIPESFISSNKPGFRIVGNQVVLHGLDALSHERFLRMWYHKKPPTLALKKYFVSIADFYDKQKNLIMDHFSSEEAYGLSVKKNENEFFDNAISKRNRTPLKITLQRLDDSQNIIYLSSGISNSKSFAHLSFSKIEETEEKWIFYFQNSISVNFNCLISIGDVVNFAPLPLEGVNLLVLRSIINMSVDSDSKKIALQRYVDQLSMLRKNFSRVRLEGSPITSGGVLWQ